MNAAVIHATRPRHAGTARFGTDDEQARARACIQASVTFESIVRTSLYTRSCSPVTGTDRRAVTCRRPHNVRRRPCLREGQAAGPQFLGNPAGSILRSHLLPSLVWPAQPQIKASLGQQRPTGWRHAAAGRAQRRRPDPAPLGLLLAALVISLRHTQVRVRLDAGSCLCGEGPCRRLAAWRWRPPGAPLPPRSRLP